MTGLTTVQDLAVSQTLTASYVAGKNAAGTALTATVGGQEQAIIVTYYTPKTGQSNRTCTIQLEFTYDGATIWIPLTKGSDAAASGDEIVTTLYRNPWAIPGATGGTRYEMRVPVALGDGGRDSRGAYSGAIVRILAKEDGSANFGALTKAFIMTYGDTN